MDHSPLAQHLGKLSATMTPVVMPRCKIRCTVANYYIDGKPAEAGKEYTIDAQLARALVEFKRAECVRPLHPRACRICMK
jgi:hypothetical protein